MERLFRADVCAISVSLQESSPFAATTRGSDITFTPRAWRPDTQRGWAMLAHEIAHAFQQQTRGLHGSGVLIEPLLEAEADVWACLSLLEESQWRAFPNRPYSALTLRRRRRGPLQPWIKMPKDSKDDPESYLQKGYSPPLRLTGLFNAPNVDRGKPIEEKWQTLTNVSLAWRNVRYAYRFLFGTDPPQDVEVILTEWMGPPGRAEMRYYHTYAELTWAMERERESRRAEKDERTVAIMVLASHIVRDLLRSLGAKVAAFLDKNGKSVPKEKLAAYGPLHKSKTYADVLKALSESSELESSTLIALLHDAKDAGSAGGVIDTKEKPFQLQVSENKTLTIDKFNMRYNVSTVDEADDWTLWMREQGHAVWAGPSYTMISMWTLAAAAGANMAEMTAMGYAMFAYWSVVYPHSQTPIHRFHETMAGAQKFGLPYFPQFSALQNWSLFVKQQSIKKQSINKQSKL